MTTRYAPGRKAWGECGRSGARALLKDLVFDGRFPNMRVLPDWREDRHPQETLPKIDDAIALYRPAPQSLQPPTSPVLVGDLIAGPAVSLAWSASTSAIALISDYLLYRATGADGEFELLAMLHVERDAFAGITSVNQYTDDTVVSGQLYRYYMTARAVKGGESAPSNVITISAE